jgi:hypothetical protein
MNAVISGNKQKEQILIKTTNQSAAKTCKYFKIFMRFFAGNKIHLQ